MKELVHYLLEPRVLLVLLAAVVILTLGYFDVVEAAARKGAGRALIPVAVHVINEGPSEAGGGPRA